MHKHWVSAACLIVALAACQADGRYGSSTARERDSAAPVAGDRSRTDVPTGATTPSTTGGSTEGPHEGTRGSTPPGTSRDGQPPVGGAIVDPSGAVTGNPPPPGMR
ncbi:MAG: hypothetical protein ACM3SS_00985 [Rhodospirillaceae bacterium]